MITFYFIVTLIAMGYFCTV